MKKLLLLCLLLVAVDLRAQVTVEITAVNSSVTCTYQSDTQNLGTYTWSGSVEDFNTYGPEFSNDAGTFNPDLRGFITGGAFIAGAYVFNVDSDNASTMDISLVSEPSPPPPPEPTLWDWWVAGWNMALGFCGFGLLLRVVKGLRGPGSGEI